MKFQEWLYRKPHICTLTTFWDRSPSKYSPWAAMHLAQRCCHCWKYFWNSCCGITFSAIVTFYWMSSVSWNLYLFRADFIFENSHKSFEIKSGEQGGCSISVIDFLGQKLLDRERLVSWSIVMVENPIFEPKFRHFSTHSFKYRFSICPSGVNSKWTVPLISRKWLALSSFVISTCESLWTVYGTQKHFDVFGTSPQ
jgi:hypothetical protein